MQPNNPSNPAKPPRKRAAQLTSARAETFRDVRKIRDRVRDLAKCSKEEAESMVAMVLLAVREEMREMKPDRTFIVPNIGTFKLRFRKGRFGSPTMYGGVQKYEPPMYVVKYKRSANLIPKINEELKKQAVEPVKKPANEQPKSN